jgi:hypothetical protein
MSVSLGKSEISLTRIRDNKTVVYIEDFIVHDSTAKEWARDGYDWRDSQRYLWEDGNYSCNCNRFLFFERALGKTEEEIEELDPCKDDAGDCGLYENYRCDWIKNADTSEIIYEED